MEELLKKLEEQDKKLDDIYATVRKIKIYFLTALIFTVIAFVVPLIGLVFLIPWFLKTMGNAYQGLL
ncbi:MAG: hypothetical protein U9M90_03495 [Patescibacteria group bacterium]|nr:hypothetical protein [Patescibacteria group bacterium]